MIGAMTPILLAHLLQGNARIAWQNVSPSHTLCYPEVVAPTGLDLYRVAYERVKDHQYTAAARVYYQLFRCANDGGTPINPLVSDDNQLQPFDIALRAAAAGKFLTASAELKQILRAMPDFGEARFLMGVFQWAGGRHSEARATWSSTITAPYFTMSPDSNTTPQVVTEAAKFLWWATASWGASAR